MNIFLKKTTIFLKNSLTKTVFLPMFAFQKDKKTHHYGKSNG